MATLYCAAESPRSSHLPLRWVDGSALEPHDVDWALDRVGHWLASWQKCCKLDSQERSHGHGQSVQILRHHSRPHKRQTMGTGYNAHVLRHLADLSLRRRGARRVGIAFPCKIGSPLLDAVQINLLLADVASLASYGSSGDALSNLRNFEYCEMQFAGRSLDTL